MRYVYTYAVALKSAGRPEEAILVLQGIHNAYPDNVEVLNGLVALHRDLGNLEAARLYANKLRTLSR